MSKSETFHKVARELTDNPKGVLFEGAKEDSLNKPFLCSEQSAKIAFESLFPKDKENVGSAKKKAQAIFDRYFKLISEATTWNKKHVHLFAKQLAIMNIEEIENFCGEHTFYKKAGEIQLGIKTNSYLKRVKELIEKL